MEKLMEMFDRQQQEEELTRSKARIKESIRRKRGQNLTEEEQALYPEVLKEDLIDAQKDIEALYPERRHKPGH